jgi:hypothetical protein
VRIAWSTREFLPRHEPRLFDFAMVKPLRRTHKQGSPLFGFGLHSSTIQLAANSICLCQYHRFILLRPSKKKKEYHCFIWHRFSLKLYSVQRNQKNILEQVSCSSSVPWYARALHPPAPGLHGLHQLRTGQRKHKIREPTIADRACACVKAETLIGCLPIRRR